MRHNQVKCPLCGQTVRDSLETLIANDYRTTCSQCGSPLQVIGDYAYIPLDSEQADHLHRRATTPPVFNKQPGDTHATTPGQLSPDGRDPLLPQVMQFLALCNAITPSMLCRQFGITHERANDILDTLERDGVVGPARGGAPRSILIPHNTSLPGSTMPAAMGGGTIDGDNDNRPQVHTVGCTGCLPSLLLSFILLMALKACGAL